MVTSRRSPTKARTPRSPARRASPSRLKVPVIGSIVDEGLRARWEKQLAAFHTAQRAGPAGWDAAYAALGAILDADPPLYLAGYFKSATAFVASVLPGAKLSTVRGYVRVARHFTQRDETAHGVSKLAALLDYLEATRGAPLPAGAIDPDRATVLSGGEPVPFASLPVEAVRDAARAARGGRARRAEPPAVVALRAALAKRGLGQVTVALGDDRWSFGRVETGQLADLAAALARFAKPR